MRLDVGLQAKPSRLSLPSRVLPCETRRPSYLIEVSPVRVGTNGFRRLLAADAGRDRGRVAS